MFHTCDTVLLYLLRIILCGQNNGSSFQDPKLEVSKNQTFFSLPESCGVCAIVSMEEELQRLREQVSQLKADNERLLREGVPAHAGASGVNQALSTPAGSVPSGSHTVSTERVLVMSRDRKCPLFNGKTGLSLGEWKEEVEAGIRARNLVSRDQAFFIFDHLEGEAKTEIKYRSTEEREDPARIFAILQEMYGCSRSYVTLQQAFFSRRQEEGETLQEFSLALMELMERVKQSTPDGVANAAVLLRDQFTEHVIDIGLRRDLKRFIRENPTATLLQVRTEALRWEREGLPTAHRERSFSLPSIHGHQFEVRGSARSPPSQLQPPPPVMGEVMEMLKRQQEQLNHLTQTVASLQVRRQTSRPPRSAITCRRCNQLGHYASECDGERVPVRGRTTSASGPSYGPAPLGN